MPKNRTLRAMGYRKLSARPRHYAQKAGERSKNFPALLEEIARQKGTGVRIEVCSRMKQRVGQKDTITRRWAERGTRPSAPHDQRACSAHIFGAICPHEGKGAGLVLPSCNTAAMNLHLAEISQAVAPGAHAVLVLDQAGWHTSTKLVVPDNITLVSLPARSPELCTCTKWMAQAIKWTRSGNPIENVWQFMRDNWLSNRIFTSYEDVIGHCCHAWNTLIAQPWKIMSIGQRQWAYQL